MNEYNGGCETFEWDKLTLEVSDVDRSASVSSQDLVHNLCRSLCFSACIITVPFFLTACEVGVQKPSSFWCEGE